MRRRIDRDWNAEKKRRFRRNLLAWYRHYKRLLPWRGNPAPYRVWIAEIMLQQTRVQTVLPHYERFLKRFPSIKALAAASEEDVLEYWAGLGYYQRARNLRLASGMIVDQMQGKFPDTLEGIDQLPGIGRYTAGAILSIAFNQPQPVVDGNVRRVISRLHGIAGGPERFFWQQAESLLARKNPSDFNQALMELGALVCVPSQPLCIECPVQALCCSGRQGHRPVSHRDSSRAHESVEMVMLVLECDGQIALACQPEEKYIPGIRGLPLQVRTAAWQPFSEAEKLARRILGSVPRLQECPVVQHSITHRRIRAHVYHANIPPPRPPLAGAGQYAWFPATGLERLLTSSLYRKGLAASAGSSG
jgi:A/G-specific adenine glycosylase